MSNVCRVLGPFLAKPFVPFSERNISRSERNISRSLLIPGAAICCFCHVLEGRPNRLSPQLLTFSTDWARFKMPNMTAVTRKSWSELDASRLLASCSKNLGSTYRKQGGKKKKKFVQKQCEQTEQTLYKRTDGSLSQNTEWCLVNALGIWDSSCGVYGKEELVAKGCSVGDLVLIEWECGLLFEKIYYFLIFCSMNVCVCLNTHT